MRTLTLTLFIFAGSYANAQLTISAGGGINTNTIRQGSGKGAPEYYSGINGWQAGLHAEYTFKHWYIYTGAELDKKGFSSFYVNFAIPLGYQGGDTAVRYSPIYLTVPAGVGYRFTIDKVLAFKLFGGAYGSAGIGGSATKDVYPLQMCGDFIACPEEKPVTTKNQITYTKGGYRKLTKTNGGLQFGAGVQMWRKFELSCIYNICLADIYTVPSSNTRLRMNSLQVNAAFNIITFGHK